MAKKKQIEGKDHRAAEHIPTSDEVKVDMVQMIISGQESVKSLSDLSGCAEATIRGWVKELAPGFDTLDRIDELDIEIIEQRAEKLRAASQIVVIKRILELLPGEKNMNNLASILKELKKANKEGPPGPQVNNNFFTQYVNSEIKKYNNGK